ncbi:MAG: hypothetical protein II161_03205 [Erysipelotrichaceae bacterium]|nr:hypothetical protein [Erysipelotrichaceae bacterium]
MDELDIAYLRDRLRDYYGTAASSGLSGAMAELNEIDSLSDEEVRERAGELGLDR